MMGLQGFVGRLAATVQRDRVRLAATAALAVAAVLASAPASWAAGSGAVGVTGAAGSNTLAAHLALAGALGPAGATGATGATGETECPRTEANSYPVVTRIEPASGPASGGTKVTIYGERFTVIACPPNAYAIATSQVFFGSQEASFEAHEQEGTIVATAPPGHGSVEVRVHAFGYSSNGPHFTYIPPAPTVTGVSPAEGPPAGGTEVKITGTSLGEATGVKFGSVSATSFKVESETSITAVSPPGTPGYPTGRVPITVTTPGGTSAESYSDEFVYRPVITRIEPTSGTAAGGTRVMIYGEGFAEAPEPPPPYTPHATNVVKFGSELAESAETYSNTEMSAVAPPGVGTVSLRVSAEFGGTTRLTEADEFTYIGTPPAPVITRIEPSEGPASGGTSVRIVGSNLTRATAVTFGTASASFYANENGSLSATAPAGSGTVDVTVTNLGGASATGPADRYTYRAAPVRLSFPAWPLTGSIAVKKLGQSIALPSSATFTGAGEVDSETGAGSLSGSISVPAFTSTLKLFGGFNVSFGMSVSEAAPLRGTLAASEATPGDERLSMPANVDLSINSVSLLGLTFRTDCTTVEPVALPIADTLSLEALKASGFSSSGTTTLPRFECSHGILGGLFGWVLTALMSGPENAYTLNVASVVEKPPPPKEAPPTFAGLESATTCIVLNTESGSEEAAYTLKWEKASDEVTPASEIVYEVYQSMSPGGEGFLLPTYTTAPGVTEFTTPPLRSGPRYFVVRARDKAGLEDANKVEREGENLCV